MAKKTKKVPVKRKRKPKLKLTTWDSRPITLEQMDAQMNYAPPKYTPSPILTLCGQLEDAILLLETRISNSIAKINSLM